jgi:hypothetical protein
LITLANGTCPWGTDHVSSLRDLPRALARTLAIKYNHAAVQRGLYTQFDSGAVNNILEGVGRNRGKAPDTRPIVVQSQLRLTNERLTGGKAVWGDFVSPAVKGHTVRSHPFMSRQYRKRNLCPIVAYVPYRSAGPEGEEHGEKSRPTLANARPAEMHKSDGSGVHFGRVLLLFDAYLETRQTNPAERSFFVYIQPLPRYRGPASMLVENDPRYVRVYEAMGADVQKHHDTAWVVVEPCRILCEVAICPDFQQETVPAAGPAAGMPCSVAGSSKLWIVDLVGLQAHRSNVARFGPRDVAE